MNDVETSPVRCVNEGCSRPAERGERYCAACGLERELFRRDVRQTEPARRAPPWTEADRR